MSAAVKGYGHAGYLLSMLKEYAISCRRIAIHASSMLKGYALLLQGTPSLGRPQMATSSKT